MRPGASLQLRLGLGIGILMTVLWITAASVTALVLRNEMDEVFDSALRETAQRILPLAVVDLLGREDLTSPQHIGDVRQHDELFTYVVRDVGGRVLMQSHNADPMVFPPYEGAGFSQNDAFRFYNQDAVQGTIRITVAEPLAHRHAAAREMRMALGLPLFLVIPIALIAVILAVRTSLGPLRRFRDALADRTARDMSPVPAPGLPSEIAPVAETLNALLDRLRAAFDAERSFAANAAHELRTPLAGAIAQAQRLRAETQDPAAGQRAADIESTLKRLTRLAERLMQLARAEGGRLRMDGSSDLRPVAQIVVEDIERSGGGAGRIELSLPDRPVLSDLDPDAFGILCRNLVENALRHGRDGTPVLVSLSETGFFSVANDSPLMTPEALASLTGRFERAGSEADGSGLGLAIVDAIAERSGSHLELRSPRPGAVDGFEVRLRLSGPSDSV
ncbi:ATP-binding protein [Nioella nitratireducens]|uniref:ATP-binding protein n=1 Tax=Nioella nitratireducens TaxID=1287720 RepID=UPI0008FD6D6E|nr:ATP-binding protein [Nioella nitratireducens]